MDFKPPITITITITVRSIAYYGTGQYVLIAGLAQDNENLDFDEKSLFAISESDAIDAVAPIRIILAISRLANSFLFIYLFTAVTYVIYYVHNRSVLFFKFKNFV